MIFQAITLKNDIAISVGQNGKKKSAISCSSTTKHTKGNCLY